MCLTKLITLIKIYYKFFLIKEISKMSLPKESVASQTNFNLKPVILFPYDYFLFN